MNFHRTRTEERADPRGTDDQVAPAATDEGKTGTGKTDDPKTGDRTTGTGQTAVAQPTAQPTGRTTGPQRPTNPPAVPGRSAGTNPPAAPGRSAGTTPPAVPGRSGGTAPAAVPGRSADTSARDLGGNSRGGRDGYGAGGTDVKRTAALAAPADETVRDSDTKRQRTATGVTQNLAAAAMQRPTTPPATPTAAEMRKAERDHATAATTPATSATEDVDHLNRRMERAVGGFVDDPRRAVREADAVLDEAVRRLTRMMEERRDSLRGSWRGDNGDKTGTEELRVALTRYRDLTRELLSVS
jgi:hypothetical protein